MKRKQETRERGAVVLPTLGASPQRASDSIRSRSNAARARNCSLGPLVVEALRRDIALVKLGLLEL